MTKTERIRQTARAEAMDDVAAIIRKAYLHSMKVETKAEWLQMSWTFSNEAFRIRRALNEAP